MKSIYDLEYVFCHVRVTYSKPFLHDCDDDDTWWIGFDCAHCFDGYDIETAELYFGEEPDFKKMFKIMGDYWRELNNNPDCKICSLAYVKDECKKLIDHIEKECCGLDYKKLRQA